MVVLGRPSNLGENVRNVEVPKLVNKMQLIFFNTFCGALGPVLIAMNADTFWTLFRLCLQCSNSMRF